MENLVYFENLVRGATTSSREQFGREFVFKKKKKGWERKKKLFQVGFDTHTHSYKHKNIIFSQICTRFIKKLDERIKTNKFQTCVIASQINDSNNTRSRGDISSNRRRAHTRRALYLLPSLSQEFFQTQTKEGNTQNKKKTVRDQNKLTLSSGWKGKRTSIKRREKITLDF